MAEKKILIVEDDMDIAHAIKKHLEAWNLQARCVENFADVMTEFSAYNYHLVLMDITLPFFNGYYWCQEIRKISQIPVLFISSASDNMNIVMAIQMGGDDFVAKPFDLSVLTAKIQALLRRSYDYTGQVSVLEHKGALLNTAEAVLFYQDEKIELTKNEYRILQTLMENKGKIVSRERLMEKLWENDSFVDENTLLLLNTALKEGDVVDVAMRSNSSTHRVLTRTEKYIYHEPIEGSSSAELELIVTEEPETAVTEESQKEKEE